MCVTPQCIRITALTDQKRWAQSKTTNENVPFPIVDHDGKLHSGYAVILLLDTFSVVCMRHGTDHDVAECGLNERTYLKHG